MIFGLRFHLHIRFISNLQAIG